MTQTLDIDTLRSLDKSLSSLLGVVPFRFSLPQLLFFLRVAAEEERGEKVTLDSIRRSFGEDFSGGLHTSYKSLLEPDGATTKDALGLITRQANPENRRENLLSLTPKGRDVLATMVTALAR